MSTTTLLQAKSAKDGRHAFPPPVRLFFPTSASRSLRFYSSSSRTKEENMAEHNSTAAVVVVHDVLGTLFSLSSPIKALQSIFGPQLQDYPPNFAELIVMDWYHEAQRDFATLSINGRYRPIADVFKSALPRVLLQAGLAPPASFASSVLPPGTFASADGATDPFAGDAVVDKMMASLQALEPRPGMVDAFASIYASRPGLQVWGATNGSLDLTKKLFSNALGSDVRLVSSKEELEAAQGQGQGQGQGHGRAVGLYSCDEDQVAKPDPRVYKTVLGRIVDASSKPSTTATSTWFVASHTWDLFAARTAGFQHTAWVSYEEFYDSHGIYGTPDIVGKDMAEVAQKILDFEDGKKDPK